MSVKKISDNVFCIATILTNPNMFFEGIWNVPTGVTINSYLVRGKKNVLVDITINDEESENAYLQDLATLGLKLSDIDILILNHMELDHTGFVLKAAQQNPDLQIYATNKGVAFLKNFFKVSNNLNAVADGDTLDLGDGAGTLQFFETPNVHWPETMMTYYMEKKILFPCDCFGGYSSLNEKLLDTENSEADIKAYEEEALRYYANIMSSFNSFVLKAVDKVPKDVKSICPSHGIIWLKDPKRIIQMYKDFAGYGKEREFEKEVCVIWGSMYGCTKIGVDAVIKGIEKKGVKYTMLQIPNVASTFVLAKAYKAKALVLAMPTYEYKMFPPMAHILDLFERKHYYKKTVLRIGSWGWVGGAKNEYEKQLEKLKWESLPSYEWQGIPSDADLKKLEELGAQLANTL